MRTPTHTPWARPGGSPEIGSGPVDPIERKPKERTVSCPTCKGKVTAVLVRGAGQVTVSCGACGQDFVVATKAHSESGRLRVPLQEPGQDAPTARLVQKPGRPKPKQEPRAVSACPFCGEEILAGVAKCRHCGEFFDGSGPTRSGAARAGQRAQHRGPPHDCRHCGGGLRAENEAESGASGCLVAIVGLLLAPFLLGIPIVLYGLHLMMKRRGLYRCKACEATFPRKIKWYEFG